MAEVPHGTLFVCRRMRYAQATNNRMTIEASRQDKEELVKRVLDSQTFAKSSAGEPLLKYLFARHLDGVDRITNSELFEVVHPRSNDGAAARMVVKRLRHMLDEYF